jgi:hypothetical protein
VSSRGVAKGRAKAATTKAATTKSTAAKGASATDHARGAARAAGALASKAATVRTRRPEPLDDAIQRVLGSRAAWAPPRETDAPALRRSQLAALGLSDPGEGPVRDGPPPLPANAMLERLDRARQQPSKMWHVQVTMDEGMLGCEKCGMPLWSGVRFCRRCGWLQLPAPPKSRPGLRGGPAHGPGPAKSVKAAMDGIRSQRRNSVKGNAG